jgi:hypothetical protein
MRGSCIIALSILAHTALLSAAYWLWPAARVQDRRPFESPSDNTASVPDKGDRPLVELLLLDKLAPIAVLTPPGSRESRSGRTHLSPLRSTTIDAASTEATLPPMSATGPNRLSMRAASPMSGVTHGNPSMPNLHLGSDAPKQEVNDSKDPDPLTVSTGTIVLHPTKNGGAKADLGALVARIDATGKVSFRKKPNFHIKIAVPSLRNVKEGLKASLARWLADPYYYLRAANTQRARPGLYAPPVLLPPQLPDQADSLKPLFEEKAAIISGGFDLSDALMNSDPYGAEKMNFIRQTKEARDALYAQHKKQGLAHSKMDMRIRLNAVLTKAINSAAKRALIFAMWDECTENGNDDERQAATIARETVIDFVKEHFAVTSSDAYSAAELSELNAKRTSTALFAPY